MSDLRKWEMMFDVALRKESVDRNALAHVVAWGEPDVALRKESVDRNKLTPMDIKLTDASLSARRAWIEIRRARCRRRDPRRRSPQGERG